jgi:hypothetical protein
MKKISKDLHRKIEKLAQEVKDKLKKSGIVVPEKNTNGSISLGKFIVDKDSQGFYTVSNYHGESIAQQINLPQTAALVANNLALGKSIDKRLLTIDAKFGYAGFDEQAHRRSAERYFKVKDYDRAEIMLNKALIAAQKKESYHTSIKQDFEKLLKFR